MLSSTPLSPEKLDRSFDSREHVWPVFSVAADGVAMRLAFIAGSGPSDRIAYAARMPDSYENDTVRGRECPETEGATVAVWIGNAWYETSADIYAGLQLGEQPAEALERLNIDETGLLPHPYGGGQ